MNDIKPIKFCGVDSKRPVVIAGPCSAETEEQVMETAKDLAKNGVRIFRAGIWKPRSKPGGFEGVGSVGLTWLQEVKKETGMLVATEVANKQHVEEALNAGVDVLWIGARTSANPFAMQEIADSLVGADVPVLVRIRSIPILSWGLVRCNASTMLESGRLAPFTVDSVLTANICTAICRSGTSLLNCDAVCRN